MRRAWKILLAFIGGTVFAELGSDPTDYIFFQLRDRLTSEQAAAMWYFLTASFYAVLFIAAYLLARTRVIKPHHMVYVMAGLTVFGFALSWRVLSTEGVAADRLVFILGIPLVVSLAILKGLKEEVD
ncbi:MAG: hypothetical protein QXD61_06140 [Candidatus Caldarchaeum sp.]